MYVCMYVRTCLRVRAHVHVLTFVRIHYTLGSCVFACIGPATRATRTYIHTYDVAAHCATMAQRHRYSGPHVRRYVHMALLGFMCLACVGLAMRATRAYIRTNDVAAHCATVA